MKLPSGYELEVFHSEEEPERLLSYDVHFAEGCTLWATDGHAGELVIGLVVERQGCEISAATLASLVEFCRTDAAAELLAAWRARRAA